MKLWFFFIILFFIPTVFALSNECDWEVNVLSDNIFENKTSFEFRYFINKVEGSKTNVTLNRTIEDVFGNIIKDYNFYIEEITNRHTTPYLSPNLNEGVYLIKGEIFPDCNDTELKNNKDSKLIIILPEAFNQDYTKLKITEFLSNPKGYDDAPMPDGEWVELYNSGDNSIDVKGLIINDDYGNGLVISNTNVINNNTIIQPHSYLTIYRNEAGVLELNNDFDIVKLFYENILLDEVSYSHTKEDLSWSKFNNKWILTFPTPDKENYVKEPDYSSYLKIDEIYLGNDNEAKFGDSLRIRIVVYKGDTTKYNLDLYLVDENNKQISKRSEINLEDTFTNYTLIVPIQIEPNCNKKYPDGTYKIILKGLDEIDTKEIEIKGITESLCEEIKVEEKSSSEKSTMSQNKKTSEIKNETSLTPITSSTIYESTDIKARNIGIYFFCAVLLILIIYLIFGKSL